MFEPKLTDPNADLAKTYPQTVFCSRRNCEAKIVVGNWPMSEEGWSGWRVVDCSLLPPGSVHCDQDCLSQAKLDQQ